jgi:hypothetical protein
MNRDLMNAIAKLSADSLTGESSPADDAINGVRALDVWERGSHAAMLFLVDAEADLIGTGDPALYDVYLENEPYGWRGYVGASVTFNLDELSDELATLGPGLHEVSRSSNGSVRLIWTHASPELEFVRLVAGDQQHDRKPGQDGYVLLGTITGEPITYAHAIGVGDLALPSEPILL